MNADFDLFHINILKRLKQSGLMKIRSAYKGGRILQISLLLIFSQELMLGSGFLVQSEHVFLLFSFKLVLFSSNFFDLDANFFGNWPFLIFRERFLGPREFPPGNWHFLPFG